MEPRSIYSLLILDLVGTQDSDPDFTAPDFLGPGTVYPHFQRRYSRIEFVPLVLKVFFGIPRGGTQCWRSLEPLNSLIPYSMFTPSAYRGELVSL